MIKEGQSLLDFINFLPLQAVVRRKSPITNKEAQTLLSIWESDKDQYGNLLIPEDVDATRVASLTSKGLIQTKPGMAAVLGGLGRSVEITKQGREIIRNIILHSENSSFDKVAGKKLDYESIYVAIEDGPGVKSSETKTASWSMNYGNNN